MPSSWFYFLAVFTAELAPFIISHSSSNTRAAQRAYVGTDDILSGNVLRSQPAQVNGFYIWTVSHTVTLVICCWSEGCGSLHHGHCPPSVLAPALGFGLENILGVLCGCSLFVTVWGKPVSFLERIMGRSLGDF